MYAASVIVINTIKLIMLKSSGFKCPNFNPTSDNTNANSPDCANTIEVNIAVLNPYPNSFDIKYIIIGFNINTNINSGIKYFITNVILLNTICNPNVAKNNTIKKSFKGFILPNTSVCVMLDENNTPAINAPIEKLKSNICAKNPNKNTNVNELMNASSVYFVICFKNHFKKYFEIKNIIIKYSIKCNMKGVIVCILKFFISGSKLNINTAIMSCITSIPNASSPCNDSNSFFSCNNFTTTIVDENAINSEK